MHLTGNFLRRAGHIASVAGLIAATAPSALAAPADYMLRYGDTIGVTVVGRPELSIPAQPIRPDGQISLPLVAEVPAAGRTVAEVTASLNRAYLPWLQKPQVVVTLTRVRPLTITVLGQVGRPGTFDFAEQPDLTGALATAGGLTPRAAKDGIKVVEPGKAPVYYDLDKLLSGSQTIPRIQEGSVVDVSEVWYPDPYRLVPVVASVLASTVIIMREWPVAPSGN